MDRQSRILPAGILAVMFAMVFLTGCTTEEQKEAAKKYQQQAEYYAEGNSFDKAQKVMEQALEQTPKDEDLQEAADKIKQKADEMKNYNETMKAAIDAVEKDDAKALDELQESEEGKALAQMAGDGGSYIYLPEGGTTGKGIGFYNFHDCGCHQWYYGDYKDGKRDGNGIWYYTSSHTEDGNLYKEVYNGEWGQDMPNGKGHQLIVLGDKVDTDQKFKVKDGLFYGTYKIKDKLEDGTVVTGKYKLKKGKYVTISDKELEANNFAVPDKPHLAIAFLYDKAGELKSCTMVYAKDVTKGVKHFYQEDS